ncbi:MAG: hypothetical protein ACYST6_12620 [Planctomycetota bacterium]|jgi:hypothetical protein
MTTENDLQERLEGLGHAVGSDDLLIDNVISRIEAMPAPDANENLVRRFIMNRFAKLAAAAAIIVAVALSVTICDKWVTPAYAIADVPELYQMAKSIHMKGRMYFSKTQPAQQQLSVAVEYWLDIENAKWRLAHPAYTATADTMKIHEWEKIFDGQYEMLLNHTEKSATFSKLSRFQQRLFFRRNICTIVQFLCGDPELFDDYAKVGQELIDGQAFDIWEVVKEAYSGPSVKMKFWLSPTTGEVAKVTFWRRTRQPDWVRQMDINLVERDVEMPGEIFTTVAPPEYELKNTRDTATRQQLSAASISNGYLALNCHILFAMADGTVIVGSSSEGGVPDVSQAELFKDLEVGGQLPKTAVEVYAVRPVRTDEDVTYKGYHLAHTRKEGKFYEWAVYVPDSMVTPAGVWGYRLLHKSNMPEHEVKGSLSILMTAELTIENQEDFATFVLGAMAELSDDGKAPENVTYEGVLQLAEEIRASLSE